MLLVCQLAIAARLVLTGISEGQDSGRGVRGWSVAVIFPTDHGDRRMANASSRVNGGITRPSG